MNVVLSLASAAAFYSSGHAPENIGEVPRRSMLASHTPRLTDGEALYLHERYQLPFPVSVAAPAEKSRRSKKTLDCHAFTERGLRDGLIPAGEGLLVTSPELTLLHLAAHLDVLELTMLMSEYCGMYCLDANSDSGFRFRRPLTTLSALAQTASRAKGARGVRTFRNALAFAQENGRSPAETKLFMRLSLPRDYGGYGICQPISNSAVGLAGGALSVLASREVDLCWPNAKLILEYDSYTEHDKKGTYKADRFRANELTDAGYTVLSAGAEHLRSVRELDKLATVIARRTEKLDSTALQTRLAWIKDPDPQVSIERFELLKQLNKLSNKPAWVTLAENRAVELERSREADNARRRLRRANG